ncbi:MAG: hypothetical protein QXN55_00060 [Candidatus Nitrosotenuis sp.]
MVEIDSVKVKDVLAHITTVGNKIIHWLHKRNRTPSDLAINAALLGAKLSLLEKFGLLGGDALLYNYVRLNFDMIEKQNTLKIRKPLILLNAFLLGHEIEINGETYRYFKAGDTYERGWEVTCEIASDGLYVKRPRVKAGNTAYSGITYLPADFALSDFVQFAKKIDDEKIIDLVFSLNIKSVREIMKG